MHEPVMLTLGAEGALIDIDSTLFIQFALFAIMGLVASRLLFRPYLKMREERSAGIEGAREDAEHMQAEATARLADYEDKLAVARGRAQAEHRTIRAEASAHEAEVTSKAQGETQKALAEAREKVAAEVSSARGELMPRADELAREMVAKLLGREVAQ